MPRIHFYFFAFLVLFGLAIRVGICKRIKECDRQSAPGSDTTTLSTVERMIKDAMLPLHIAKNITGTIKDRLLWRSKPNTDKPNTDKSNTDEASTDEPGTTEPAKKKTTFSTIVQKFQNILKPIYPETDDRGTQWCGGGNKAKDEDDLGIFKKTDACCREHDNCKNNIEAGDSLINLQNDATFTRSACSCDNKFYDCLKEVASPPSNSIGITYFNILGPQCFECPCPTDECTEDDNTECKDKCTKYRWINSRQY